MWDGTNKACRWLVAGQSQPWTDTLHRFAPSMCPENSIASITQRPLSDLVSTASLWLGEHRFDLQVKQTADRPATVPWVLLWHIQVADVPAVMDQKIKLNLGFPTVFASTVLPIVACDQLGATSRLALGEIGIALFLRHTEDVVKYRSLIRAHFARCS